MSSKDAFQMAKTGFGTKTGHFFRVPLYWALRRSYIDSSTWRHKNLVPLGSFSQILRADKENHAHGANNGVIRRSSTVSECHNVHLHVYYHYGRGGTWIFLDTTISQQKNGFFTCDEAWRLDESTVFDGKRTLFFEYKASIVSSSMTLVDWCVIASQKHR